MKKLTQYIEALTNLYGMVHKEVVQDIYNQQNDEKVTIAEIDTYFTDHFEAIASTGILPFENYFSQEIIIELDNFIQFIYQKGNKPYYVPDKEVLLKYAEYSYFEKAESYYKIYDYVYNNIYSHNEEAAACFCDQIYNGLRFGLSIDGIISVEFERLDVELTDDMQSKVLYGLMLDLKQDVRLWGNNGHTTRELSKIGGGEPDPSSHNNYIAIVHDFSAEKAQLREKNRTPTDS